MHEIVKQEVYNIQASERSKTAITLWIVVGLLLFFINHNVRLFSLEGLLFFVPGIFIASLAAAPLFILKNKIDLLIIENGKGNLIIIVYLLNILEWILDILIPVGVFYLLFV